MGEDALISERAIRMRLIEGLGIYAGTGTGKERGRRGRAPRADGTRMCGRRRMIEGLGIYARAGG